MQRRAERRATHGTPNCCSGMVREVYEFVIGTLIILGLAAILIICLFLHYMLTH